MSITKDLIDESPYKAYSYSYPHKTAYRELDAPYALGDLWSGEKKDALFLYVHLPFCEMRCGFCNLFTVAHPEQSMEQSYLSALEREAQVVAAGLGRFTIARMAIGGGTPTFLSVRDLHRTFDIVLKYFDSSPRDIPTSVETSPHTATPEKIRVLADRGVNRVSIGVQSFIESEVLAVGRAQNTVEVHRALTTIREAHLPTLNIDLIYGLPDQTVESLIHSLTEAVSYAPEEIYIYPLYIRALTSLAGKDSKRADYRVELYRQARSFLLSAGYRQVSMRMFQLPDRGAEQAPVYCCQSDGMVGIGSGARSYTAALHYSGPYAVQRDRVKSIIAQYTHNKADDFALVNYGIKLDLDDQRRRFVIQSILQAEGMLLDAYEVKFAGSCLDHIPDLRKLLQVKLLRINDGILQLTERGMERSDEVGVDLYSPYVSGLMRKCIPV
ncbi:MAG: STM4012 family radical SAM protein [Candidatus Obscuribacterales bacterium]|nr:STM4012 family radical SAM protein [Candidatus Obscuribacterales bacterium]